MLDVFLDALLDSLKVLGVTFVLYFILSFFEEKMANVLKRHEKVSPLIGATSGLIPQCGVSVVAADLYIHEKITLGTIFAVFFACSDEALPIMFSSKETLIYTLPLIGLKFIFGFLIGFLIDVVYRKSLNTSEEYESHVKGCCGHDINHDHDHEDKETFIHEHILHPIIHSLKIFLYVFIVNMLFGIAIYYIGEDNILNFLSKSKYFTPLVATLVGLIPNCASSVLLTELFVMGGLPFGALFSGLVVNAGLGLVYLLKNKKTLKSVLILEGILVVSALILGYAIILVMNLF
ncbi:MAG: arsenic efflux protein [Gammaproteobacteria bacterium]|nr:arsenic efflux protein [Gammaproteobacteria bacterium]